MPSPSAAPAPGTIVAIAWSVEMASHDADALADVCAALDVLGIQQDDATTMSGRDLSPGRERVTLYCDPTVAEDVGAELRGLLEQLETPADALRRLEIAAEDWNATWKVHFRALDIGRRLRVEPPWDRHPAGDRVVLVIDPGMAFGTGSHETTRMAAALLEDAIDRARDAGRDLAAMTMIDVGTGSGLLAMAAVRLGLASAVGVDNDAVAIESARENLEHNDLVGQVELLVAERPAELAAGTYDIVVANIISSVLLALRADLVARLATDGVLLLSGVLVRERDVFIEAFLGSDLELVAERDLGEWKGFAVRRRA